MIELRSVTKRYLEGESERTVLQDVSVTFGAGEMVGLLGRSGSGKSTLLNLLGGIDSPDSGEIVVDGTVLNQLSERERTLFRRERVGFIFQFFNLIPTLTVRENLLLPLELKGLRDEKRAVELLERVGLGDRLLTYPDRLSGGEQQRVAVARALVHKPGVVLADEPTGNLDPAAGRVVLELLGELARQQNTAVVMATHSREAAEMADRIYSIRDGKLE